MTTFHVDQFSMTKISGWAYDEKIMSFPKDLTIRTTDGLLSVYLKNFTKTRNDVISHLGVKDQSMELGFSVNLLDAFNCLLNDYEIVVNGDVVWRFSRSLDAASSFNDHTIIYPKHTGQKQVIIVYDESDAIYEGINDILNVQKNFFSKEYTSGVSFYAVSVSNFEVEKPKLGLDKKRPILISSYECADRLTRRETNLFDHVVYLPFCKSEDCFVTSGLVDVVNSIINGGFVQENASYGLLKGLSAIIAYSDLLFPTPTDRQLCYQGGKIDDKITRYIQRKKIDFMDYDVVTFVDQSDIWFVDRNHVFCNFVNTGALRFLLDSLAKEPDEFLLCALTRGLSVFTVPWES